MRARHWIFMAAAAAGLAFFTLVIFFIVGHANAVVRDDAPITHYYRGKVGDIKTDGRSVRIEYPDTRTAVRIASTDANLLGALRRARADGEVVTLRLRLLGAYFEAVEWPIFWVESMQYGNEEFGPFDVPAPWSWRVLRDQQVALLRGLLHQNEGQIDAALNDYDKSLHADELPPIQRGLAFGLRAQLYRIKADAETTEAGRDYFLSRAAEDYAAFSKLPGFDAPLLRAQAGVLARLGAYEEALAIYGQARKLWPDDAFMTGMLEGMLLRTLGRYRESIESLDAVSDHVPNDFKSTFLYQRGWTLLLLGRHEESSAALTQALEGRPKWTWGSVARACADLSRGEEKRPIADLRAAADYANSEGQVLEQERYGVYAELENNIEVLKRRKGHLEGLANITVCRDFLQPNLKQPLRSRSKLLASAGDQRS